MSEIDDLIKQKKAIEAQIKALRNQAHVCGIAKLDKFPTSKPDEWGIYVYRQLDEDLDRRNQWQSVIRSTDKKKCIEAIPRLIKDLQELYDRLKEEDK